jgi:transposase
VIETTGNRSQLNIIGALNLSDIGATIVHDCESINSESIVRFFCKLRESYPLTDKLHIILDGAGYHRSDLVKDAAFVLNIELHYLPPYSPNLNPIEQFFCSDSSRAGVSTATVSRALMNPEKVSSTTRKRVESAVLEASYSPNSLARNLRCNESKTIVAIVPDICDSYFTEIIRGIEDVTVENGYLVLLGDSGQQKKRDSSLVNLVFTKQADGMLLLGIHLPFDVSKPEQKNLPPPVMACEFAPELELPTVHIDNLTS